MKWLPNSHKQRFLNRALSRRSTYSKCKNDQSRESQGAPLAKARRSREDWNAARLPVTFVDAVTRKICIFFCQGSAVLFIVEGTSKAEGDSAAENFPAALISRTGAIDSLPVPYLQQRTNVRFLSRMNFKFVLPSFLDERQSSLFVARFCFLD